MRKGVRLPPGARIAGGGWLPLTNSYIATYGLWRRWHFPCTEGGTVRYHVLKAGVTIRNAFVCLALIAGSYLASGLVNASPVTQPTMTRLRTRGVILTPAAPAATDSESPGARPDTDLRDRAKRIHSL